MSRLNLGLQEEDTEIYEEWSNWTLEKLEKQMSPSHWNPLKTPVEVIDEYIQTGSRDTASSILIIPHELNIFYWRTQTQKLDLYGVTLPSDSSIFFNVHGGYWQEGSKDISGGCAKLIHQNGLKTVAFGYTLAPDAKIQEIEDELVTGLDFITKRFPQSKLVCMGHSAGAQLLTHILHKSRKELSQEQFSQIIGLILVSGVYDLRPLVNTSVNKQLGMSMTDAESLSALLSNENQINPKLNRETLNILVMVGNLDSPEFQRQSVAYYKKLGRIFPKTKFWKSESDDHFTIVQNMTVEGTPSARIVQQFIKECLAVN